MTRAAITSISMRVRICAALHDAPPMNCAQLAEKMGVSAKRLSPHLSLLAGDNIIFRLACTRLPGLRCGPLNYYALQAFSEADVPAAIPPGLRLCTCCQTQKPETSEFFGVRDAATGSLKTVCRACVSSKQKQFRVANAAALAKRRAETRARLRAANPPPQPAAPTVRREKIAGGERITFADHWKPYREPNSRSVGWHGYASPLTRID